MAVHTSPCFPRRRRPLAPQSSRGERARRGPCFLASALPLLRGLGTRCLRVVQTTQNAGTLAKAAGRRCRGKGIQEAILSPFPAAATVAARSAQPHLCRARRGADERCCGVCPLSSPPFHPHTPPSWRGVTVREEEAKAPELKSVPRS